MSAGSIRKNEYYVTPSNLKAKSIAWKKDISIYNIHRMKPDFRSSCLLVVDMQNFFLNPQSPTFTPGGLAILPNISKLIQAFRKKSFR